MNRWFGEPWPRENFRAPVCEDDKLRIPVPVGHPCYLCEVEIVETDRGQESYCLGLSGVEGPLYAHAECLFRNTQGCYDLVVSRKPWTPDHVCSAGSYREDALKVWAWFQNHPGALR